MYATRQAFLIAVALGCSTCLGCGGKGDLSGTVSLDGKTLSSGSVLVLSSDGIPKSSPIEPDGSYHIKDIVSGTIKISVNSPDPGEIEHHPRKRDEPPPPPKDRSKWFPIHADYADFEKSGLTFELSRGPNTFDIKLQAK
jgi:hypothetical protein